MIVAWHKRMTENDDKQFYSGYKLKKLSTGFGNILIVG